MKKPIFVLTLILLMATSLVSGTLSMYTTTIDNLARGSVAAKEFIFTGSGTDSFSQGVKIAPSETVNWQFDVKNYDGAVVTETDLYYKLTFHVSAAEGKSAIEPLVVTVKDTSGKVLGSITGTGDFDVTGSFPLMETGQEKTFVVQLAWPADGGHDIDYAGGGYGTALRIDAAASQLPYSGGNTGGDTGGGDTGEEPQAQDVAVKYETNVAWTNGQSGNYQYNFRVTITNNSDEPIENWFMTYKLPTERIVHVWNGKLGSESGGTYTINNPAYNNPSTDSIEPGQSVSFGGNARGMGTEAIENVTVGGSNVSTTNVSLSCEFGNSF